mmetsp:Transcript_36035/g.111035  ORF Transcript_36035/g.111035 Transcript_36035/m.111035 type:complete len:302 (-) Transcript_36035:305-1210(-)
MPFRHKPTSLAPFDDIATLDDLESCPRAQALPPRKARAVKKAPPVPAHVRVRDSPGIVLVVAARNVAHRPMTFETASLDDSSRTLAPLYLCDAYATSAGCPLGDACPDVHADTKGAKVLRPHTAADGSLGGETSPARMGEAGAVLLVARPNENEPTLALDAGRCLLTKAAKGKGPLSVCAHFAQKGVCDYGAACRFVHPLHGAEASDDNNKLSRCPSDTTTLVSDATPDADDNGPQPAAGADDTLLPARFQHEPYNARGWRGWSSLQTAAHEDHEQPDTPPGRISSDDDSGAESTSATPPA